jgi:sulfite exporter TauE/SafE
LLKALIALINNTKSDIMSKQSTKLKIFALCGVLAPIIYVLALAVGNILDPSYSQVGKTVSELSQQGAPNRDLLNAIFIVYNILLIPFGVGMYYGLKKGWARNVILAALVVAGVLGVAWTLFFPLDVGGKSESLTGQLHLIVGGLVVPLIFALELSFWRSARKNSRWQDYNKFSLAIFAVTLVFGLTTVAFVNSDYRGLLERITTGSFLLWMEVIALKLYSLSNQKTG